jgi:hypothetical protein
VILATDLPFIAASVAVNVAYWAVLVFTVNAGRVLAVRWSRPAA